jgi:hypothetical protein
MIRKLLLLLVVTTILQNTSYGQGEILANAYWQNANNRIVIRIALRNNTNSTTGQMIFGGMRFGIQYNGAKVNYAGYHSYLPSLSLPDFYPPIGPDTDEAAANVGVESPSSRSAEIGNTGVFKTLQRRYINLSTSSCDNAVSIPAQTAAIMIDIYFTLVSPALPSDYHLNNADYGFDDPQFIAQFFTKNNGGHDAKLDDASKEIAILVIRNGQNGNPYQPFDATSCTNGNFAPITINSNDIKFVDPVNGILSGKAIDASVQDKDSYVQVKWKSENNQLVDYFEVQRKEGNGDFKTIGLVMSKEGGEAVQYEFKDKITARDVEPSYRIKVFNSDKIITYSDVKKIRLGSEQSVTVKVFPNPSSESIRINLPVSNGVFVCRMYSTEGRMVQVTNVSAANPTVNIKSLQTGSYFMELYQPQTGKRYYTQFSKQ